MAPPLLAQPSMPEPDDNAEEHVERRVVYETVSSSSTKASALTMGIVIVIAIVLVVWVVMQLR